MRGQISIIARMWRSEQLDGVGSLLPFTQVLGIELRSPGLHSGCLYLLCYVTICISPSPCFVFVFYFHSS